MILGEEANDRVSLSTLGPSGQSRFLFRSSSIASGLSQRPQDRDYHRHRQDLEDFQAFIPAPSLEQAATLLLSRDPGEANALVLDYKAHLMDRHLSANTINRRLTALRSLVKLGRTLGLVSFTVEVQSVKADSYRDTRGPGRAGFRDMLDALAKRNDRKSMRDRAILRCLFDLGLRRAEVLRLDLEDLDREAGTVAVLGKGRTDKMKLTLPLETRNALEAWISI